MRVVVLTGAGKSFSAGADLDWMRRMAAFRRGAEPGRRASTSAGCCACSTSSPDSRPWRWCNGAAWAAAWGCVAAATSRLPPRPVTSASPRCGSGSSRPSSGPMSFGRIGERGCTAALPHRRAARRGRRPASSARARGGSGGGARARARPPSSTPSAGRPGAQREAKELIRLRAAAHGGAAARGRDGPLIARARAVRPRAGKVSRRFSRSGRPDWRRTDGRPHPALFG